MDIPARRLHQAGFETVNLPYASFRKPLEELVDDVAGALPPSEKVTHFVTHSMGGIVLRCLARRHPGLVTGKVIMMAPPNQGSEIIDWLADSPLARWSLGPGGMQLSTRFVREKVPDFPPGREINVIMGRRAVFPVFSFLLPGENDGIVTVEGGRMPGVRRFAVMDVDHTLMMGREGVLELLRDWLQSTE